MDLSLFEFMPSTVRAEERRRIGRKRELARPQG
jgi:hypothetical protein